MSEDAIRAATRQIAAAFNDGDIDRLMRFHGSEYVDVNLPQPRQTHEQRAEYYRRVVASRRLQIIVNPEQVIVDGDHAAVRGTILLLDGTEPRELRYMELWEKHASGWKSIWGIDAPVHD